MTPEFFKKCNPPFKVPAVEVRNVHLSQANGFSTVGNKQMTAESSEKLQTNPTTYQTFLYGV